MRNNRQPEAPNIVKTGQWGGTKVWIADNYAAQGPKEVEEALENYHRAGWKIIYESTDNSAAQKNLPIWK